MNSTDTSSRGEQTRHALIDAALKVFGQAGFDAASTRSISKAANVNQALIGYHFGGKRGLYLAVFGHILSQITEHMAPVIVTVSDRVEGFSEDVEMRRQEALEVLIVAFNGLIEMFGRADSAAWVRLIVREQQDPTDAFEILYEGMMGRMMNMMTMLVSLASDLPEDSEACRVRTHMLVGQVLLFHIARGTTSRHLSWSGLSPDNINTLKEQFRLSVEAQFAPGAAFQ